MPRTNEICLTTKNSNCQSTLGGDKAIVNTLFGLSPSKISYILNSYFSHDKGCALALLEIIEHCQNLADDYKLQDLEAPLVFSQSVSTLVRFEQIEDDFSTFKFSDGNDVNILNNFHQKLMNLIIEVEKQGIEDFTFSVISALQYVKTPAAYRSLTLALSTVQMLYTEYVRDIASNPLNSKTTKS